MQIIALDKTGTITAGQPQVTDLLPAEGCSGEELLQAAYTLESRSEHPLARAIVAEAERRKMAADPVEDFRALPGNGLTAKCGGKTLYGGNLSYIKSLLRMPAQAEDAAASLAEQGKTPLFFAEDGRLLGIIAVADVIKSDSAEAIASLRKMGIEVCMLTGDNARTAKAIGAQAGVDRVIADVLPDGKEAVIRKLQQRGMVAMVGDGINDAPALTRADIGIAIGAGTDVAIDSADVVLMNSRLSDVAAAVRLSRATLRNIHENLFWAFFYNAVCIPLAAGLFAWKMNPMIGAAAMSLSSFTVCMNALRLNLFNMHDASKDRPMRKKALPPEPETQDQHAGEAAEKPETAAAEHVQIRIDGMMCHHCENAIKKALEQLPFVAEASANFETGLAEVTLSGDFDEEAVRKAVEGEDYGYLGLG